MNIEKVVVSKSGYGTCLRWEKDGLSYHIWQHTPNTVFKNPPLGVEYKKPGYFSTRRLDATKKVNAEMVAEAQRIAKEQGLYEQAEETERQEKADEEARRKADIILGNKRKAAEEMYTALQQVLEHLTDCRHDYDCDAGDERFSCTCGREDAKKAINTAIAKADGQ